ncbi:MAG: hypothetical protein GY953_01530 [bacterium]|nr:hypothetical protein [bacterium]
MRFLVACVLLWAVGASAVAQAPPAPEELLSQIRARAKANLERLPDYICVETVERERRASLGKEFEPYDILQLEVGLVGDRELFAWPNSARFSEAEVADLVGRGTIGNGNFGLHARNVFLSNAPKFEFRGEENLGGKPVYRYDFDVPIGRSTYTLRVPPNAARVAFRGSFWVDTTTLDLLRLTVEADDIPEELGLTMSSDIMEYQRIPIGGGDFLLPKSSRLTMLGTSGNAGRNFSSFANCRQYVGESSISFGGAGPADPVSRRAAGNEGFRLPPRTLLELSLSDPIDPRNSVVGDPVRAVLSRPVKEGREILVPRGALAHGRLVRIERYESPVEHYVIGLEFHTLEFNGQQASFRATMRKAGPHSGLLKQAKRLDPTFNRKRKKAFMQILVNETHRGQGILHWTAKRPLVAKGLKMRWEVDP